ncbi:MAG: Fe-S cluster domain-containing protein [Candidatus Ratteibacteria bacterium]|nr:Fe-S cluster domain-containing protein [Candidatus Ratteibacteria bacterium]
MIILSAIILGGLGLIMGFGLAWAFKKLAVKTDERIEKILNVLPGGNCGACGFAGCQSFAQAVVKGKIEPDLCSVGGEQVARQLAGIMGVELVIREKEIALVRCRGGYQEAQEKFIYQGITDCRAALLVAGGKKECSYGCLGLGTCVASCPFEAIKMGENGLPEIDEDKCVGCGRCVASCPRGIIELVSRSQHVFVLCRSLDKAKQVKEICRVGCIGCGLCVKVCPVKAITIKDNLPRINPELCVACGECVKKCPTHSIYFFKDIPGRKEKEIPMDKFVQSTFEFKK